MTQSKLRSIVIVLSMAALVASMGCTMPDMNQAAGTPDANSSNANSSNASSSNANSSTDVGDAGAVPGDGGNTNATGNNTNTMVDNNNAETPPAGDNTGGDSTQGGADAAPGNDSTDPNANMNSQPGNGDNGGSNGDVPPPGGGTQGSGSNGDNTGSVPQGDPITAEYAFDGPGGSRIEMNPLLPSILQSGVVRTPISLTPSTTGFVRFLCDDTISLGNVSFFDGSGGDPTTLENVTFARGTDFECGQTVTLSFSLPSEVTLTPPP